MSNDLRLIAPTELNLGANWHAAYTVPRHEKMLASQLANEVETYLPLYHSVRRWNGRHAEVELPLFPNYVFVRFTPNERIKVLRHPSVINIVSFAGKPACLSEGDIELLKKAIAAGKVEPHPLMEKGRRIRVKSGLLMGLEATVLRRKGPCRLVVSVATIQQAFVLELDTDEVELSPLLAA